MWCCVLVAGQLTQSGGFADGEVAGSGSAYGARPPEVVDLGEAAAGATFQSGDQDVSLRKRAEDLGDEEFNLPFAFSCLFPTCALAAVPPPA